MVGARAWGAGKVVFFASRVSQEASNRKPMPAISKSKRFMKSFMKTVSPSILPFGPVCTQAGLAWYPPLIVRRRILLNSSLQFSSSRNLLDEKKPQDCRALLHVTGFSSQYFSV